MSWINRLLGSLRKSGLEEQLDDELRFHIEMRTQEFMAAGMTAEEARQRARLQQLQEWPAASVATEAR